MRTLHSLALAALVLLTGCYTSPISGKRSVILSSSSGDVELGLIPYQQILGEERIITSGPEEAMVQRVASRLVDVVQRDNLEPAKFEWEVALLDNDQVANAFCLPGGKMAVYTGILPVTQSETGLAVVMGHEIAHALARHGASRVSQQTLKQLALQATVIFAPDTPALKELADSLTETLVLRPNGRGDELEADEIGLILMARAGYDPREAVEFWGRMAAGSSGAPPEFLSTHPSHETRVDELTALMPRAMAEYEAARGGL